MTHLFPLSSTAWIRLHMTSLPVVPQTACVLYTNKIQNHKNLLHICHKSKHTSGPIAHDFIERKSVPPFHSIFILVLSIFLVLSCDINLMCWEAIDDHLLWTKVLYDFSLFVCLFFLLIWPCFRWFLPSLLLTPHSFVFLPCLLTASGYGGGGMTCDALHLLAAQICTDNFKLFQNIIFVCYLWFTNSVWYIKGWVWQLYRPQFITKILANYMWNSIFLT